MKDLMDPERWRKIEALYEAALGVESARRGAFLEENSAGDESLRCEVESLLRHGENAGDFPEDTVAEVLGLPAERGAGQRFPTTSWSLVLAAGQDLADSAKALADLCEVYWHPIYAYVRRRGESREDAEDLTQEFFARILQGRDLAGVRRERGRFRSFLLASVRHFLANEWDRTRTQKRGGRTIIIALDFEAAEDRFCREQASELTPEALFERHWALDVLEKALARLGEEYAVKGQWTRFEQLQPFLTDSQGRGGYRQAATNLDLSGGALKVAVHRLRRRFGELLRMEIASTVADPGGVDDEIRFLLAALGPQ